MNALDKLLNLGIGAYALTREKIEKATDDMIRRGEMSREEGKAYVEDVLKRMETNKREIETKLETFVHDTVHKLSLPTHSDVEALRCEVETLKKEIAALKAEQEQSDSAKKGSTKSKNE